MKVCAFPIGFPTVVSENFTDIQNYFGIIHCRILPPKKLLFPVLPTKLNNKLLFVLCYTCGRNLNRQTCNHSNSERAIEGTWVTEEVKHAVKKGYIILKIFSIWHFNDSNVYDKSTKTGGLFTEYVNKFLKMKTEASGFPERLKTQDERKKYIEDYEAHEGVRLDIDNMKENPGMKAISKLFLNSLWGRFGLNSNKSQFKLVSDLSELYEIFMNDQYCVNDINFLNEHVCQIFYSVHDEMHAGTNDTNVIIAAFVTCYARLKLLDLLEAAGENVIYYDTDSLILVTRPDSFKPTLGDYLGELTSELDIDDYIVEGVFPGPKNYAFKTKNNHSVCKVKCFTLNYTAEQSINFDSMKDMILNFQNASDKIEINVEQSSIKRDKKTWNVFSEIKNKVFSHVYDKRIVKDDFTTIPYGYII